MFIAVSTKFLHWVLSSASSIHSVQSYVSLRAEPFSQVGSFLEVSKRKFLVFTI